MTKTININKSPIKKATKIILIVLLTPIALIILIIALYFGTKPIFDNLDHDKYNTLNTQMQSLFEKVKTTSNGADEWKYANVCISDRTGWMETGVYHCVTSISTQKTITTVQELNDLQAKYYPVINSSDILTQQTELDPELPSGFGKKFVVSSAEKDYTENKSGVECTYLIKLYQNKRDTNLSYEANNSYGSEINNGLGNVFVSLRCQGTARNHWYPLSETTDLIIP